MATKKTKRKTAPQAKRKAAAPKALHHTRFPGESKAYRSARDNLLRAEIDMRRLTEALAALRRKLPLGAVARDYEFDDEAGKVKLSELFAPGKDTLVLYSYMYSAKMEQPCPMCTSMLDGLDGNARHIIQRVNLAVVAKSPIERLRAVARERGWRNLRLLSSAHNTYNVDYHGEGPGGEQWPMLNVFVKRDGKIRHAYATEMLLVPSDKGQNARHVDPIWPLWNLLDFTPEGRGKDWYPRLQY